MGSLVLMTVPRTLSPHMETLHLTKTGSNALKFSLHWEENYPLHSCLPVSLISNSWPILHLSLSLGPKAVIPSYENSSLSFCMYPFLHWVLTPGCGTRLDMGTEAFHSSVSLFLVCEENHFLTFIQSDSQVLHVQIHQTHQAGLK